MTDNGSDHWSEYWAQGRMTSLPQDFAANYDGEVADFWNEVFSRVPESGHVLDLCAGNGAIAMLAASHFKDLGRDATITAVDAAEMNPGALGRQFPGQAQLVTAIDFLANCRVEDLQLDDESVDLVTSQYGIEYCDWTSAARQVARVLKPGGRFVMVCHTPSSDILAYMNREHAEYTRLEELGFFSSISAYLDGESGPEVMQKTFSGMASELAPEFSRSSSALYGSVLGLIQNALNMSGQQLDSQREALGVYASQMRAGRDRLADMLRVNRALEENPQWTGIFEQAGLEENRRGHIQYRGKHNAGQYYEFSKPGPAVPAQSDG